MFRKLVCLWLDNHYDRRECKSIAKAQAFKKMGNKEFQAKNYNKSIESYTKCALYASINSYELPVAMANRSASLFYLGRYDVSRKCNTKNIYKHVTHVLIFFFVFHDDKDCIKDIQLAIKLNYPKQLQYKLYLRLLQCYLKLGKQQLAEETLSKVQKMIHDSDYIVPSMKGEQ